jgi:hypothetical protein
MTYPLKQAREFIVLLVVLSSASTTFLRGERYLKILVFFLRELPLAETCIRISRRLMHVSTRIALVMR